MNKNQLEMIEELNLLKRKQWERIEVLGLLDQRNFYENFPTEKSPDGRTYAQRYEKRLDKPTKKFYINRKDSPGRNIYEDFTTREKAILMFDKLLCDPWHARNSMEDVSQELFTARVKEFQEENNIDLICDCRKFKGNGINN